MECAEQGISIILHMGQARSFWVKNWDEDGSEMDEIQNIFMKWGKVKGGYVGA